MTLPHEEREQVRNPAEHARRRGAGGSPTRKEALAELPMVAALLVMAVVVALVAAGGPVLDMLAQFQAGR